MEEFGNNLIKAAKALDEFQGEDHSVTQLADTIVKTQDDKDILKMYKIIRKLIPSNNLVFNQKVKDLHDALLDYLGYERLLRICSSCHEVVREEKDLKSLLIELNQLVGLENVKNQVVDLIDYHKVQQLRDKEGLSTPKGTLHLAFIGNPGTGKTTVARIIGHIYKQLGLLSKGHFMEVSRTDLIAGYQGQTALKVKAVIDKAKGGVLFIDEAYSITENEHSDSYGRECLTELTKALEDFRKDLVVIVAGYTEPMKQFFNSNPGLKSRFNTFINFEDYNSGELLQILKVMCDNDDYILTQVVEEKIKVEFNRIVASKNDDFANARFVRNLFEEMIMNHARRVSKIENPSLEDLKQFQQEDIPIF